MQNQDVRELAREPDAAQRDPERPSGRQAGWQDAGWQAAGRQDAGRSEESARRRGGPARVALGALLAVLLLVGSLAFAGLLRGPSLSGTYASLDGLGSLEFRAAGRVYVTFADSTFAGEYELDGDRVIIKGPGGSHVCTRSDNKIEGFGMAFLEE